MLYLDQDGSCAIICRAFFEIGLYKDYFCCYYRLVVFIMIKVGLTGGTGSGKGYVCNLFEKFGIKSLDTDMVSHLVYNRGEACYNELVCYFGNAILDPDKNIDRKRLFDIAFASEEKYKKLSEIAYKHILLYCDAWLDKRMADGDSIAIIDAPMLFESGYDQKCDIIIAVVSDMETQIERVIKRDGISREAALKRLEKQTKNEERIEKSDIIIYNGKDDRDTLNDQIEKAVELLKKHPLANGLENKKL